MRDQELSLREVQMVELLLQGCENPEIARQLGIKERIVKYSFDKLYTRYGIAGGVKRVKLAVLMYRQQRQSETPATLGFSLRD